MTRVYKLIDRTEWDQAKAAGTFAGAEIDLRDGYIHLSTAAQAQETASLHFTGRRNILLLEIEAESLGDRLKWEPSRGGQLFPHLYGPLVPAAVIAVHEAPLDEGGAPRLPPLSP